jgi:hypothetical protein
MREWQVRIRCVEHVEAIDLIVQRYLAAHRELVDEVVHGLRAIRSSIEDRLEVGHRRTVANGCDSPERILGALVRRLAEPREYGEPDQRARTDGHPLRLQR